MISNSDLVLSAMGCIRSNQHTASPLYDKSPRAKVFLDLGLKYFQLYIMFYLCSPNLLQLQN